MSNKKSTNKIAKKKNKEAKKHDRFIKKIFESQVAAREFLEEYVPEAFLQKVDLSKEVKLEKESYIEDSLKTKYSDLVLSLKTKENKDALVYVLIEGQSRPDHWIAFRLWQYMFLLLERHRKSKNKIPLVCPIVLYNGRQKYNAPLNFWALFEDPATIKKLWSEDYILVDLEAMQDDEVNYQKHHSLMLYLLKHAHQRDFIKAIEELMQKGGKLMMLEQDGDFVYLKSILWYCASILPKSGMEEVEAMVARKLPENKRSNFMKSFEEECTEKGISIGIAEGKSIGIAEGKSIGIAEGKSIGIAEGISIGDAKIVAIAQTLLSEGLPAQKVADVTKLPLDHVLNLWPSNK